MDPKTTASGGAETAVIADLVERLHKPHQLTAKDPRGTIAEVPFVVLPTGLKVADLKPMLDAYRDNPERREGTAKLFDIDSFIAHVLRFKDEDSVVFADNTWKVGANGSDWKTPSFTAVLDYHEAVNVRDDGGDLVPVEQEAGKFSLPRFGKHRARYDFPLSDEFKAWMAANGARMSQPEFAAFIEERALDISPPPSADGWFTGQAPAPADDAPDSERKRFEFMDMLRLMTARLKTDWAGPERMMDLSRGLKVHESSRVENSYNMINGTGGIVFVTEHQDDKGEKLEVPGLFLISIPVFRNGPKYLIPVRLRYQKVGSGLAWSFDTYRHDKVFDHAFDEACTRVRGETGLPLFVGTPEA